MSAGICIALQPSSTQLTIEHLQQASPCMLETGPEQATLIPPTAPHVTCPYVGYMRLYWKGT